MVVFNVWNRIPKFLKNFTMSRLSFLRVRCSFMESLPLFLKTILLPCVLAILKSFSINHWTIMKKASLPSLLSVCSTTISYMYKCECHICSCHVQEQGSEQVTLQDPASLTVLLDILMCISLLRFCCVLETSFLCRTVCSSGLTYLLIFQLFSMYVEGRRPFRRKWKQLSFLFWTA